MWWVLAVIPLLVRLLVPGSPPQDEPPDRWDVLLAVLAGVGLAGLCGFWLVDFHMLRGPLTSADFHEYCGGVVALRGDTSAEFTRQRSVLAALPSVWLSRSLGVLDGMAAAALVSMAGIGAGLYGWGRAMSSRLGGIAAVLAGATLAPLVIFSRALSFYPEVTAAFTLGIASALVAARWRRDGDLLLCGLGAGLCFLIDLRGLLWGLTALGVGGLVVLAAPRRRWPLRMLILLLPVWLAWHAGALSYSANTNPLEGQTDVLKRISDKGGDSTWGRAELPVSEYIWGHSDPLEIPVTLYSLSLQSRRIPPWMKDDERSIEERRRSLDPVLPLLAASAAISAAGLIRRRRAWVLMAALATALPFITSTQGAITLGQLYLRYLGTSAVLMAALMGTAFAMLAGHGRGRLILGGAAALLLTLGVLPSPLSPVASWREPVYAQRSGIIEFLIELDDGIRYHHFSSACVDGLERDQRRGLDAHGALYGGMHTSPRELRGYQRRGEVVRPESGE